MTDGAETVAPATKLDLGASRAWIGIGSAALQSYALLPAILFGNDARWVTLAMFALGVTLAAYCWWHVAGDWLDTVALGSPTGVCMLMILITSFTVAVGALVLQLPSAEVEAGSLGLVLTVLAGLVALPSLAAGLTIQLKRARRVGGPMCDSIASGFTVPVLFLSYALISGGQQRAVIMLAGGFTLLSVFAPRFLEGVTGQFSTRYRWVVGVGVAATVLAGAITS